MLDWFPDQEFFAWAPKKIAAKRMTIFEVATSFDCRLTRPFAGSNNVV
jgi:hypothetical protein